MYKYLDRKPEVGDVVEFVGNCNEWTTGKLYIVEVKPSFYEEDSVATVSDWKRINGVSYKHYKVVETRPGYKVQEGDSVISLYDAPEKGIYRGEVYNVLPNETKSKSSRERYIWFKNSIGEKVCSTHKDGFKVLCKEKPQYEPKLGDKVVAIKKSKNIPFDVGDTSTIIYIEDDPREGRLFSLEDYDGRWTLGNYWDLDRGDADASNNSTKTKETNMKNTTTQIDIEAVMIREETASIQTDLDDAPSTLVQWYNPDGKAVGCPLTQTKNEAKAELKTYSKIGWSFIVYEMSLGMTTDIPLKNL